jgi:signal transduction histidine kinase
VLAADLISHRLIQTGQENLAVFSQDLKLSAMKVSQIVNDLLLVASVRQQDIILVPLDMGKISHEAEKRLEGEIAEAQAQLLFPDQWPCALGYAPWVEEVWFNYISNALKYCGERPRIMLGAEPVTNPVTNAPEVRCWVRDQGPGISAKDQERLFVECERLNRSMAGHGLGLAIVKRIVTKLGGRVGVESAPGMGSTFFFTLPAAPA